MLRIVQWTTGRTGRAALRALVSHPALALVGCYAWSADKVGRDAGELCGLPAFGVAATDDIEALLELEADCVIYTPYRPNIDHVVAILASGTNLVTSMYMLAGDGYGTEARARIAEAADRGRATLYASGIYPGHAPMVALAATAMCARIERLSVLESLDMSGYANEAMFRSMGIDLEPDDPRASAATEAACGSFREQIAVMAQALRVSLDDIRFTAEFAVARSDLDFGYMTIGAGRIAGIRGTIAGLVEGRPRLECRSVWKMGPDMAPNWPVENGYVIEVEGDPSFTCRIAPGDGHFDGALTTAMPLVNAIPAVVAAPAGVLNHGTLPLITGAHTIR